MLSHEGSSALVAASRFGSIVTPKRGPTDCLLLVERVRLRALRYPRSFKLCPATSQLTHQIELPMRHLPTASREKALDCRNPVLQPHREDAIA